MENATTFGRQADVYAALRPSYPDALFAWIAEHSPATHLAWDVGTGSGQAAYSLAVHFKRIQATDLDEKQIAQAEPHPKITFSAAPAHQSGLADKSADAITVATALHWFDHAKFWPEVARVGRPGALFFGWTYGHGEADPAVQEALFKPLGPILEPYWSDGNRLSWRGYPIDEIGMPFEAIDVPPFACELRWRPEQIVAFVRSWSAHKKARGDGQADALSAIESEALAKLDDKPVRYVLPLKTLAARL